MQIAALYVRDQVETMHNLAEYHIANGQHLEAATLQNAILDNFGVER